MLLAGLYYVGTHPSHPGTYEYAAVLKAAAQYGQQLKAQGLPIPDSVSLEELGTKGPLAPSVARSFEGLRVTVSLKPAAAGPQDTLMSVVFPDGKELAALGDGSIQERPKR